MFIYDSWDQVTVAASSESEDSEVVPVGSGLFREPWKFCPCRRWNTHTFVRSSAVLIGGGMRPAAATLRSAVRKLNVAHALGCKTHKKKHKLWKLSSFCKYNLQSGRTSYSVMRHKRFCALPCLAPPQRCLSSWVKRALKGQPAQGAHLCPAQGSLQENQGSKSNVPRLGSSCPPDSASNGAHQKSNESEGLIWNSFDAYAIICFIFCLIVFCFTYSWFNHMEKWDTLLRDVSMAANLQKWKNQKENDALNWPSQ